MNLAIDELLDERGAIGVRLVRLACVIERIGHGRQRPDVEGQAAGFRRQQNGRLRARGVAHAELVIDIGVEDGEVGDGVFGEDEAFEHRLVDHPGAHLLVGAHAVEARASDGGRDDHVVHGVEIDQPAGRVGLPAEGHDDKADGLGHGDAPRLASLRGSGGTIQRNMRGARAARSAT